MIVIPQGKKIVIIALSLFVATFSSVLYFIGGDDPKALHDSAKTSVLENYFHHTEEIESLLPKDSEALVITSDGDFIDANENFQKNFQYTLQDLVHKKIYTMIAPHELGRFTTSLVNIMKDGKIIVNDGPYHLMNGVGEDHIVLITFTTAKVPNGKQHIVLSLKDITNTLNEKGENEGDTLSKPQGKTIKDLEDQPDKKKNIKRVIVEKTV